MGGLNFICLLLAIAYVTFQVESFSHCEKEWVLFERNCYFFSRQNMNFKNAVDMCHKMGGEVLELRSRVEDNWLDLHSRIRGYHHGVCLGVTDVQKENHFVAMSTGRTPYYIHWAKGEPNNHAGQEHCALYWMASKAWHDGACTRTAHFVCKK